MEIVTLVILLLILVALGILIYLAKKIKDDLDAIQDPIIKVYFAQKLLVKTKTGINVDKFYDTYIEKMVAALGEPLFDDENIEEE